MLLQLKFPYRVHLSSPHSLAIWCCWLTVNVKGLGNSWDKVVQNKPGLLLSTGRCKQLVRDSTQVGHGWGIVHSSDTVIPVTMSENCLIQPHCADQRNQSHNEPYGLGNERDIIGISAPEFPIHPVFPRPTNANGTPLRSVHVLKWNFSK